ncbi:Kappa-type opioid receptor [Saguinus oedipus]|uniref:Kappa-type opioid receptor n=1 Tax=Saguinus oedipus TaxID=9490 RepID=A0ABQ9UDT8_SAGOE|nr:Kappa-type opioid receptor [Saguinus oedipus]
MDSPVQIFRGEPGPTCAPSSCLAPNSSAWFPGWAEPDSNGSAGSGDAQLEPAHMSPAIPVIITAVYSVVFVVGLVGNSLVMFVIIRSTSNNKYPNINMHANFPVAILECQPTET